MDDLISRQAAIDALCNYLVGKNVPCDGTLTCRLIENEVINKLPTVHHEHGTNLAEVGTDVPDNNVGDMISREQAIDAIKERYYKYGRFAKIEELVWSIEKLPPIQPVNNSEVPNSSDCISRQAAIDAAMQDVSHIRTHEFNAGATRAANRIKQLSLAEPKIIRCKDCKWNRIENRKETTQWLPCRAMVTPDDFSCIHAERKEVTT